MAMTKKFLLFDLKHGAFMDKDAAYMVTTNMQKGAVFTEESAKAFGLEPENEKAFLQIPLTQEFVDALPFTLADTAPDIPHSETMDVPTEGDFVVLTDCGFYDEKYNSMTNTSRPKVNSFNLDYANLYNKDMLSQLGTEYILQAESGGIAPIIVPVSEVQQECLAKLPEFSPEKEPHGFFMKPIGETQRIEPQKAEAMPDLGTALNELQEETKAETADLPFSV